MLKPGKDIIFTELSDGEGVLLNLATKLYYSLNATGTFMWRLIEKCEAQSEPSLVERLESHYRIPRETALSDVQEFLSDLLSERLLEDVA